MTHRSPSRIGRACLCFALAACLGTLAAADTRISMQSGSEVVGDDSELPAGMREAIAAQEPTTSVYWLASDRAAWVGGPVTVISRLDRDEAYLVNSASRSYSVIDLAAEDDAPGEAPTARIAGTGETRRIGSWETERYDMTVEEGGETMEVTLWVSDDVGVDLGAYRDLMRAAARSASNQWLSAFLEVEGFPVRMEVGFGFFRTWQQLVSIDEAAAPADVYEIPAGYERSD